MTTITTKEVEQYEFLFDAEELSHEEIDIGTGSTQEGEDQEWAYLVDFDSDAAEKEEEPFEVYQDPLEAFERVRDLRKKFVLAYCYQVTPEDATKLQES